MIYKIRNVNICQVLPTSVMTPIEENKVSDFDG